MKKIVIKNFSSLIVAQAIYKVFAFLMTILMARFLGPEKFGQLSLGLSFVWAFLFISDFGLGELFIRDVSNDKSRLKAYANNTLTLKCILAVFVYAAIAALARASFASTEKFWIIMILGGVTILDSFMYFFRCIFRIKETMEYEGMLMVLEALIKVAVVFIAIRSGINIPGAILMSAALLSVSVINFVINAAVFFTQYRDFAFSFDGRIWKYFLKTGPQFAMVYILSLLNFRIGIMMLSSIRGDASAGWFSAVYRLIEQFILIPITLSSVYLPIFSKAVSHEHLRRMVKKIVGVLLLISVCIVAVFYVFRTQIILAIYGKGFEEAIDYVFILSLVLFPFFVKPVIEKVFYAIHKQLLTLSAYALGVILNIILSIFMIPRLGVNGAALSIVISEMTTVVICLAIYQRIHRDNGRSLDATDKTLIGSEGVYE